VCAAVCGSVGYIAATISTTTTTTTTTTLTAHTAHTAHIYLRKKNGGKRIAYAVFSAVKMCAAGAAL